MIMYYSAVIELKSLISHFVVTNKIKSILKMRFFGPEATCIC